jgi:hypothetical protein
MTVTSSPPAARTVVGNISLSLDGRVTGPGGEYDMSWVAAHGVTDAARDHMVDVTSSATTALLGRKNYQGFAGYWPVVASDEQADPRDRAFAQWLNAVEKIVFSTTLQRRTGTTPVSLPSAQPPLSGNSGSSREATLSSWPAPAFSGTRRKPVNWTGSASLCALNWWAVAPACSGMARPAHPGRCPV